MRRWSGGTVQWLAIIAIGAGVGFLGGLFGKGGSAIATPLLAAIGVPPIVAVASPLPATIPSTLVAYRRYRHLFPSEVREAVSMLDQMVAETAGNAELGGTPSGQ